MALGVRWLTSLALIACFAATEVLQLVSAAGRAYPVESENYITDEFQRINHRLDWDVTNFLVDLSGHYSHCNQLNHRGPITVDRRTPEGEIIAGYVDYMEGLGTDASSVKEYLKTIIDGWIRSRVLHTYLHGAKRFGCSVRPGCNRHLVTTCLFSQEGGPPPPPPPPSSTTPAIILSTTRSTERTTPKTTPKTNGQIPTALAFTREQYDMAESAAGMKWDRSHFLENLSGSETNCMMIELCHRWTFAEAEKYATERDKSIAGRCGFSPNNGSTPDALEIILRSVKHVPNADQIGCSLIPDCLFHTKMYVVVSCLYEYY